MKALNQIIPFLSGMLVLTAFSIGAANASIDYAAQAQAEADIEAARAETDPAEIDPAEIVMFSQSQSKNSFIGELYFDFVGANATLKSITINPSGYTTIRSLGRNTSYVLYEGMYKSMMPIHEGEVYYAVIGKNAIAQLDSSGNLMYDCRYKNQPCISKLRLLD